MKNTLQMISMITLLIFFSGFTTSVEASRFRVLVVMSYEEPGKNPWCKEIKEGIDNVLGETCDIDYFYMNTKIDFDGGEQKAKEAHDLYKKNNYDGVIAADDNAQFMFVVPYLKNSVKTPVMFCGVNSDNKKYGYPSSNVSGILERGHFRESIAFAKQLSPNISKIAFIAKDSPSGNALKRQVEGESNTYLAEVVAFELIRALDDIQTNKEINQCDAIFIDSLEGIRDKAGKPLGNKEIIPHLSDYFKKPLIGANNSHVEFGALCAVVKSGQEQGEGAAEKLLEAMQGKPLGQIPITKNYKGKRLINVSILEKFNIVPKPISLLGATLIKTKD